MGGSNSQIHLLQRAGMQLHYRWKNYGKEVTKIGDWGDKEHSGDWSNKMYMQKNEVCWQ